MAEDLSIQFSYVLNYFTDHVVARFHLMDYASHVHTTFGSKFSVEYDKTNAYGWCRMLVRVVTSQSHGADRSVF